jgi:uncharacterized protein
LVTALFGTASVLIFHRRIVTALRAHVPPLEPRLARNLTIAMGAAIGALVSISSIGAGAIALTGVVLLYPDLPAARIAGTDIAHAVPLTLIAGLGHWSVGSVSWGLLLSLLCGSLPGILIGSSISLRIPDRVLRYGLAATLIAVGGRLAI